MNFKKKTMSIALLSAILLSGCGQQKNENYYDNSMQNYFETTAEETKNEYNCAFDLIGEPIANIEDSGFDFDLIMNLTEYDLKTAKPYTILIDGTYAFAAAVICKDDAVIAGGIETSCSMEEIDENFDINTLQWSAAFDGMYSSRLLTKKDGETYNLKYVWRSPYPDKILTVDSTVKSDCAFVYQDSYIYTPDNDFMWFHWGDSIYDIQSSMIDKGFKLNESPFNSHILWTTSISEQLYGHNFTIHLTYNDNMQFTKGSYFINASNAELADIYEAALKDLIVKYGDTVDLSLSTRFDSIDEQLGFYRTTSDLGIYPEYDTTLYWNVNGHTRVMLIIHSQTIEIAYQSISSTGGTNMDENSLI